MKKYQGILIDKVYISNKDNKKYKVRLSEKFIVILVKANVDDTLIDYYFYNSYNLKNGIHILEFHNWIKEKNLILESDL